MRKLYLKALALTLSLSTIMTSNPVLAESPVQKKSKLPLSAKIAMGVGAGGVAVAGIVGLACWLAKEKPDDNTDANSEKMNGNFTNTANLCYWHAFVQHIYSLKSFRKFIKEIDLEAMKIGESLEPKGSNKLSEKIEAFREIFEKFDKGERIDRDSSLAFAKKILSESSDIGNPQDINEVWPVFIGDISDLYTTYNGNKSNIWPYPIQIERLSCDLHSLLTGELTLERRRNAVKCLVSNSEVRAKYEEIEKKSFPDNAENNESVLNVIVNDLVDVPCVKEALGKQEAPELDIPVIDGQFTIFVNRTSYDAQRNVGFKNEKKFDFGDGIINYKGKMFELTAVTVQFGAINGGHYYTYKKQGPYWYRYDDITSGYSGKTYWHKVKEDAETKCTMLTFSLRD